MPGLVGLGTWRLNIRAIDPKRRIEVSDFVLYSLSGRSYIAQSAQVVSRCDTPVFLTVEEVSPMISRTEFLGKGMKNDRVQEEKNQLEDQESRISELPSKETKPFGLQTQVSQKLAVTSLCLFVERDFCIFRHSVR
jgi:hypothetical protein